MTTQRDPDKPATEQTGGTRPERGAGTQGCGWEVGDGAGFDDMNIPGWSDYASARTAALGLCGLVSLRPS